MQQKRSYYKVKAITCQLSRLLQIEPLRHLITLFNPKCHTPLISPFFAFERSCSRQTQELWQKSFFVLCCQENTRSHTNLVTA